jgi:hypothetical protein
MRSIPSNVRSHRRCSRPRACRLPFLLAFIESPKNTPQRGLFKSPELSSDFARHVIQSVIHSDSRPP